MDTAPSLRQRFIDGMSSAACTVNVVTTDGPSGRFGVTVSAMSSVSAEGERPTLLVCVHHASAAATAILANGVFCVNVLREDQAAISDCFAGRIRTPDGDKFSCADWVIGKPSGAPARRRSPGFLRLPPRLRHPRRHPPRVAWARSWTSTRAARAPRCSMPTGGMAASRRARLWRLSGSSAAVGIEAGPSDRIILEDRRVRPACAAINRIHGPPWMALMRTYIGTMTPSADAPWEAAQNGSAGPAAEAACSIAMAAMAGAAASLSQSVRA